MRGFIVLHSTKGKTWYIDPYRISAFSRPQNEDETYIYLQGDDCPIYVTETPEQIIKLINEESW